MKMTTGQAYALFGLVQSISQSEAEVAITRQQNPDYVNANAGVANKMSGTARIALALNLEILLKVAQVFEKVRDERLDAYDPEIRKALQTRTILGHPEKTKRVNEILEELQAADVSVPLQTFKMEDLRLDSNERVGPTMINALRPMISDFPAATPEKAEPKRVTGKKRVET